MYDMIIAKRKKYDDMRKSETMKRKTLNFGKSAIKFTKNPEQSEAPKELEKF